MGEDRLGLGRIEESASPRDAEETLRAMLDSTADGLLAVGRDLDVLFVNKQFIRIWRLPLDLLDAGDKDELIEFLVRQLSAPDAFRNKLETLPTSVSDDSDLLRFRDGRAVECHSLPLVRRASVVGRVWNFRDVTAREQAQAALRDRQEQYRSTIDAMADAVHVVDRDLRIVLLNAAFGRWMGRIGLSSDALGRRLQEVFPFLPDRVWDEYRRVFESGKGLATEECTELDGAQIYTETNKIPVLEAGVTTQVVTVLRDITEQKRADRERLEMEAQMQQTQKLESLGVLAGGIAHDFNNLLMGILGYADLATEDLPPLSPVQDSLQQIRASALRAADLTRQLLAYAGKGRFASEAVFLNDVIQEITHLLESAVSKKVQLEIDLAPDMPPFDGDASQIRQVVVNLVTNASEALGETSGVVSLTTGVAHLSQAEQERMLGHSALNRTEFVFLRVSDTGCGIGEEAMSMLFDPFYTTKFAGRGLGLSAVLGIVNSHLGKIRVQSTPGEGAVFEVFLPVSKDHAVSSPKARTGEDPWRATGAVLVVDDEEVVRSLVMDVLGDVGFEVLTARDGREALQVFRERAADLRVVLLDLTMPHMSGLEVFREMQGIRSDVPVVLSSGYPEGRATEGFGELRPAGFIQKPYAPARLTAALREILSNHPE